MHRRRFRSCGHCLKNWKVLPTWPNATEADPYSALHISFGSVGPYNPHVSADESHKPVQTKVKSDKRGRKVPLSRLLLTIVLYSSKTAGASHASTAQKHASA